MNASGVIIAGLVVIVVLLTYLYASATAPQSTVVVQEGDWWGPWWGPWWRDGGSGAGWPWRPHWRPQPHHRPYPHPSRPLGPGGMRPALGPGGTRPMVGPGGTRPMVGPGGTRPMLGGHAGVGGHPGRR
jgi:hypothetical protein